MSDNKQPSSSSDFKWELDEGDVMISGIKTKTPGRYKIIKQYHPDSFGSESYFSYHVWRESRFLFIKSWENLNASFNSYEECFNWIKGWHLKNYLDSKDTFVEIVPLD